MFPLTLDALIAELVALRADDFAGQLQVSCNLVEGLAIGDDGLDLLGAERRRWGWGDNKETVNLRLRRVGR